MDKLRRASPNSLRHSANAHLREFAFNGTTTLEAKSGYGLVTPDVGRHMYELLGRTAPVIELPLAYHHVMLDHPLALVTAVRSLLADWRHSYAIQVPLDPKR